MFWIVCTDEMNKQHMCTRVFLTACVALKLFGCVTHKPFCDSELFTCAPSFAHTTSLPITSLLLLECCCATVAVCLTSAHLVGGALTAAPFIGQQLHQDQVGA